MPLMINGVRIDDPQESIEGKECPECGESKTLSQFHKEKGCPYGRSYVCISCKKYQRILNKDIGLIFGEIEAILEHYVKRCYECGEWKELEGFPRKTGSRRGYAGPCLECKKKYLVINNVRISEQRKGFYKDNKEIVLARNHGYWEKNKEKIRTLNRLWLKNNPEKFKIILDRRRARIAGAPLNDLTKEQWDFIKDLYNGKCAYCGIKPKKITKDHIIPLARGGSHTATNIVPSCQPCNNKKYVGPPLKQVQPILPGLFV